MMRVVLRVGRLKKECDVQESMREKNNCQRHIQTQLYYLYPTQNTSSLSSALSILARKTQVNSRSVSFLQVAY